MNGEKNLDILLNSINPHLNDGEFVFCTLDEKSYRDLELEPLSMFRETEGISVVIDKKVADELSIPYSHVWSLITCLIHSDLTAVGFLAVITHKLAEAGISVNAISAYYHDYLFVPVEKAQSALNLLKKLGKHVCSTRHSPLL